MPVYQRVGIVFCTFSLLALIGNMFTPYNDDHLLNVIELGTLVALFGISIVIREKTSSILQLCLIFIAAMIAAYTGDLGPAGAIGTVGVVLTYVYGKFQRFDKRTIVIVAMLQGCIAFIGSMRSDHLCVEIIIQAILWALFPLVGVWIIWYIMLDFSEDLLKQNRDLLEINKELLGGIHGTDTESR